jgi:cobalt-zinc-cadmium efflux system outer membrane protein
MAQNLPYRVLLIVFLLFGRCLIAQNSELSLNDAISIALKINPGLLAAQLELEARKARISQANAIPNPDFGVFIEDFAGSGQFEGFDSSQTTAQLSQRIELGGKRGSRRNEASLNHDIAKAEMEIKRREIISSVRKVFFAVLLSQERVRWMQELLNVSKQFSGVVTERISAGKIPPIDEIKAQSIVSLSEIELNRSTRELESARYELAATMGASEPTFVSVNGELPTASDLKLEELIQLLPASPDMKRAETEIEHNNALVAIEKSKSVPDLTVSGGYRKLEATDDSTFVTGVSIPLPLFDRNKSGITEAKKRVQESEQLKSQTQIQIKTLLTKSFQDYTAARLEAQALKDHVLPANQTSFDAISEGYRLGKYGYLDVLEAQRSLFQSRIQLLRALSDISTSAAELERITGKEILILPDQSKEAQ